MSLYNSHILYYNYCINNINKASRKLVKHFKSS